MVPSSFLTVSWHIWHALGWAHLIIGLIMPPGIQVRWLVSNSSNLFHFIPKHVNIVFSWLAMQLTVVSLLMSLHSIQHPFMPFYDALYIYALQVYNAIQPPLQIRSTLTLSNGLPLLSLLSWCRQQLTHDHVSVSLIATPMDEPWNNGHPLRSFSLSLLNTMRKRCDQFVRPFTLFSNNSYLVQSWSS